MEYRTIDDLKSLSKTYKFLSYIVPLAFMVASFVIMHYYIHLEYKEYLVVNNIDIIQVIVIISIAIFIGLGLYKKSERTISISNNSIKEDK